MHYIEISDNSAQLDHVRNEKIQIVLRILIVILVIITLPTINVTVFLSVSILDFMFLVIFFNTIYYILIQKLPYLYQKERISLIAVMDVLASTFIMSFVDSLSAYYPALLLWYSVGYGMRYDKIVGYIAYVVVLISWIILITTNEYWIENNNFAIGWLIAYIVIPIYYFKLVSELKIHINSLYKNVDSSKYQATHDTLTKLPNRLLFNQKLNYYIKADKKFALLFIDLDDFKSINDKFGHQIGDKVLIEASNRMSDLNNFVARISGDEFVSIVEYSSDDELYDIVQKYSTLISLECKDDNVKLSASIGIARFPIDANNTYELKKNADEAMYRSKTNGKGKFYFYSDIVKKS